ncbi:MAG: AAA family ATPase [Gammaproteobacteria bacterium]|nr:AAA family ATPase [Gammaproteobacteria bacterium]MBT5204843.1 AAA family ATPase [Gammaproteobacteria bacterium]MBT5602706.1 AAA family ATPase [Gammaproteobacteria bacterium]MBT6244996.1 AAA family ATPase [Gammaproteobacteria bacterium]
MISLLAVSNYRSLKETRLPLGRLNLVTGANGSGKSNLYKALRLLSDTALGTATSSIAAEGGLDSVLWAGPETISRAMKKGQLPVQGGPRQKPVELKLGFVGDDFSYAIDFGMPEPVPGTMFFKDPVIKREAIWYGGQYHPSRLMVDRRGPVIKARNQSGAWQVIDHHLHSFDSMLMRLADPHLAPEALFLRESIRSWRFYDHFRTDRFSPVREPHVATRTPVLSHDGSDLAAAWQTIKEIGDAAALADALDDAFPGASVTIEESRGRFALLFHQPGLLRPLSQTELSDGTLRYLLWIAALLTPRPPELMVLNEPETSLHPDLLAPLARLMAKCAESTQLWVTSHAAGLIRPLQDEPNCQHIILTKELSETQLQGLRVLDLPPWKWPGR